MPLPLRLLALLSLLLTVSAAHAQSDTSERRVVLTDGTVLIGTVDDESADPVVIRTPDGIEQRVPRTRVAEILPLVDGGFARVDPTQTRTLVSQTGRTLGSGTGRVSTFLYLIPNASYGINDRLDVTGTVLAAFGTDGFALPILGAKLGLIDTGTFAAAVGVTAGLPIGGGEAVVVASPYAAATFGDDRRSATVGVSGILGGVLGDENGSGVEVADGALLQLGTAAQVSDRVRVLGELLVPVTGDGVEGFVFLPGVRLFGEQFSVDVYGVLANTGGDSIGGFAPLANFAYTF